MFAPPHRPRTFAAALTAAVVVWIAASPHAHGDIRLITHTGQPSPDPYTNQGPPQQKFHEVHINDRNEIAYVGQFDHFSDFDDPSEEQVIQTSALDGPQRLVSENLHSYERLAFANHGDVVYRSSSGIFRNRPSSDPDVPLYNDPGIAVAEDGESPTNSSVVYTDFYERDVNPVMNDRGNVAFSVKLQNRGGPDGEGLFRSTKRGGVIDPLALAEDDAPNIGGEYHEWFYDPAINNTRKVAAVAQLEGAAIDSSNDSALFLYDQPSPGPDQHLIAQKGQMSPTRAGYHFTDFSNTPALSESNKVIFAGEMENSQGDTASALFQYDNGSLSELASSGQPTPDDPQAHFRTFYGTPQVSNGRTLFRADVKDGFFREKSLYLKDASGLEKVAQNGDPVPNGDGKYNFLSEGAINEHGEIAYVASLFGQSTPNIIDDGGPPEALFYRDENGNTQEVIREGEQLLGKRVERLLVGEDAINDDGRIAFQFRLDSLNFEAIAVWSEGTIKHVSNGHFESRSSGVDGWSTSGAGTASVSTSSSGDQYAELSSGSPVSITQQVSTPANLEILFDFEFADDVGTLQVSLDGQTIATLNAADFASVDGFEAYTIRPSGLDGLMDVPLTFTFDSATAGHRLRLDDVTLQQIPEPTSVALIALGALAVMQRRRA